MIYCVEDDSSIRELMVYALTASNLPALGLECADALWQKLAKEQPELILLDIMLPDEDGITILKKLRAAPATADIPVIMATAKGTEFDKVIGLDLGADDYLAKPFGMMEMVSRVKAVLRRAAHVPVSPVLTHKSISLNESAHLVSVDGNKVDLTIKEYQLLRLFLKNPGVAFTRENLLATVWESEFQGETRTVDVHIASLRTKLGHAGEAIKTVRGVGYRLEGEQ
jgi:two-component system, OmpR family, alkaline phosphatase synthesis response regulator PhoP